MILWKADNYQYKTVSVIILVQYLDPTTFYHIGILSDRTPSVYNSQSIGVSMSVDAQMRLGWNEKLK